MTIIKIINKKELREKEAKNNEYINTRNVEIIDDREENLKINKIINHDNPKIIPRSNEIAKIIPRYVAIPFPPLNFNQIGKICPMKQTSEAKKMKSLKYKEVT